MTMLPSSSRMLKKAVSKAAASEGPREVHTALRVGRSPVQWVLANGKTPSAILTLMV
jgi:hypothetical protein